MKKQLGIVKTTMLVALAALATAGIILGARRARAQTEETPPPVGERLSFGMIGIARGQTVRLSVANVSDAICPCNRVLLTFLDTEGRPLRRRDGSVIRRAAEPEPGRAVFLDLDADDLQWPPGPTRLQLRAVVNAQPPPIGDGSATTSAGDRIATTVEVFNNETLRTSFVLAGEARMGKPDSGNHNETLVRDGWSVADGTVRRLGRKGRAGFMLAATPDEWRTTQ
ncbi:MAG: hypothetical protein LC754_11570 [Acidobacteria bacterium]|nr:hypothetical protein [Acidobacteriota bacterium]